MPSISTVTLWIRLQELLAEGLTLKHREYVA
jgi:hypothetical protein